VKRPSENAGDGRSDRASGDRPRGPRRTPGQRAGLTREAVLAAARAAHAEDGVEALSMRRLARRLNVAPNALYSHVADRDDLIDALLDDTLHEVRAPDPERRDWRGGIETMMRRTYEVLVAHPDLVPLYVARRGARGPRAVALGEQMLALLVRGGIEGDAARQAMRALIIHTIGFAAFGAQEPLRESTLTPAAVEQHYVKSLGWLLDGIAAGAKRH
jgi:TetR/AcrR family transcriptional regulator, tetracycline repressor protein